MNQFSSILQNKKFVFLTYLLFSLLIFFIWIWGADTVNTSFSGDPRSKLSSLIYGTADRPFAERALIPFLTLSVLKIIPEDITAGTADFFLGIPKFKNEIIRLQWEEEYLPEYLAALFFAFIALLFFSFVIRSLFKELYETGEKITYLIPLLSLLCLPPFFLVGTHYIYDFPALFFFSLGLLLLIQKKWAFFFIVYFAGSINKETMIFLIFAYLIFFFKEHEKKRLIINCSLMLLISVIVKGALTVMFIDNPGSAAKFYFFRNIDLLLIPYSFSGLLIFSIILILIFYDLKNKPVILQKTLWIIIPYGIVFFISGILVEIRSLYEIFPILFLLSIHTLLFSFFKVPFRLNKA